MLDLAIHYLLLVTDATTGEATAFTRQGLAGALLCEMLDEGAVEVEERRLVAGPQRPHQQPYAAIWDKVNDDEKPRTASRWIAVLTGPQGDDIRAAVAARSLEAGVPRETLRAALTAALEAPDEELDERTRVLAMLVVFSLASQRLSEERGVRRRLSKRVTTWRKAGELPEGLALVTEAVRRNVAAAASG